MDARFQTLTQRLHEVGITLHCANGITTYIGMLRALKAFKFDTSNRREDINFTMIGMQGKQRYDWRVPHIRGCFSSMHFVGGCCSILKLMNMMQK